MIAFEEHGPSDGERVVLIHGAGLAGWSFEPQWTGLPKLRCIVPDLPDCGDSREVAFESVEQTARVLLDAPALRALEGFHVVGHSLGAKVALEMIRLEARSASPRIRSGIVASALLHPSWLTSMISNRALNRSAVWMMRWDPVLRLQARTLGFPTLSMRERFAAGLATIPFEAFMRPLEAFARYDRLPEGLATITTPVLAVAGAREPGAMQTAARALAETLPHARHEILARADHAYPWKRAEAFNTMIAAWIAQGASACAGTPPSAHIASYTRT